MRKLNEWPSETQEQFNALYPEDVSFQRERFGSLLFRHCNNIAGEKTYLFSVPGRTEIAGNHTDHNHGRVIAASIDLDIIAAVTPTEDNTIRINSEGYPSVEVKLETFFPLEEEIGTPTALVRGIASAIAGNHGSVGGFNATTTSTIPGAAGLSSSAALSILIGLILNELYNEKRFSLLDLAVFARSAENDFFGKPCGLMDQLSTAWGGCILIDFNDSENPVISSVATDFSESGYELMIVDTGDNHADLTPDYAAIPNEMKQFAHRLNHQVCREITFDELMANVSLRKELGDRAFLRVFHFLSENERVDSVLRALEDNDFNEYLSLIKDSGLSSFRFLQNVYSPLHSSSQGLTVALALTEKFLGGDGASRVHGGGFAGTIQAYIPENRSGEYVSHMENIFGKNSVLPIQIRNYPAMLIGEV